jgi:hypothetical protein
MTVNLDAAEVKGADKRSILGTVMPTGTDMVMVVGWLVVMADGDDDDG